jgi:3-methyladenine DNA glycosylase/8-oxoguanine DNA glycosylase
VRRFAFIPARPYSLVGTVERFARFPDAVDLVSAGSEGGVAFRRLLPLRPAAVMTVRQEGAPGRAVLRVELEGPGALLPAARAAAVRVLERALGASADIRGFERRFSADPLLGPAIRRFRGLRVAGAPTVWEALVHAVLAQQINLAFAASIRRELVLAFGRRARVEGMSSLGPPSPRPSPGGRGGLLFDFPTPARIAAAGARGLRGFRLSGSKRDTLLRLARAFVEGRLDEAALERMTDESVVERLTAIRGVGLWTAEVALLRGLGRPDAFPAGDLSIVKYLAVGLLGRAAPATEREMRELSESWRPYRSYALIYMYAALAHSERTTRG